MRVSARWGTRESLREPLPVLRLLAFAVIGLLCLAYLLFEVIGPKSFEGQYQVDVSLQATGGLFPGSQVSYRGVPIGSVRSLTITRTGVRAELEIHDGVQVPSATQAVVADRSPAGEQYIDLRPTGTGPPYLHDGSTIARSSTQLPPSLADLLDAVSSFSRSINTHDLRTVFDQLDTALSGTGPALGRIIDNSSRLVASLEAVEPQTVSLLRSGGSVLDTQAAHGGDLTTFSHSLRRLADTLRNDDPKTTRLIGTALAATRQLGPVLQQDAGNIGQLLTNLVTTGRIIDDRIDGLKALVVALPKGLGALVSTVHGGHVDFRLLVKTGHACAYNTRREKPFDAHQGPPIINDYCVHPPSDEQQRGSFYAPRPPGDHTAYPPKGARANADTADSQSWTGVFNARADTKK